jgi:hypothetical protein
VNFLALGGPPLAVGAPLLALFEKWPSRTVDSVSSGLEWYPK